MAKGKMIKIFPTGRQQIIKKAAKAGKIKLVPENLKITGKK